MMYLKTKALQMSSAYTVLLYIRQKEKINPVRYWSILGISEEEKVTISRDGNLLKLPMEKQTFVQQYIKSKLPEVFNDENINALSKREFHDYDTATINRKVAEADLNTTEMSRMLEVRRSDFCKWKLTGYKRGIDELVYNIAKCVIKVKSHEQPESNLMRLRWNRGYSLRVAAENLGIRPNMLWKIEWRNCMPLDLVEKASEMYITTQESIPISISARHKHYGEMIRLIRRDNNISLQEMADKTGYSESRCSYFETDTTAVPPYSYIETLFMTVYGDTDDIESVLLNEKKHDNKYIRVPARTIDYYRQVYYYINSHNKKIKDRSLSSFLKECGVTRYEYVREKWTVKQAKKALELLGLGKKYDILTKELTPNQEKILDMKVDCSKLKAERKKLNVTVHLVAMCINRSYSVITKIENGHYKCSPEILKLMSDYYGKNMEYFLEETESA